MSTSTEEPALPYRLCQYCENVTRQLTAIVKKGVKHDFHTEHYPNMQTLVDGILKRQCHLCAIFAGGIAEYHGLRTVERVLEKLGEYHNNADCPLLMIVSNVFWTYDLDGDSKPYSQSGQRRTRIIRFGYDKDGRLEIINALRLVYYEPGTDKKKMAPELLSAFTGSDQDFSLIKRWLQICYGGHHGCRSTSIQFSPTRLLDLGTRDTDDIRLVSGSNIGHVSYAALSYCWGTVPQLVLSSENEPEFERKIPFDSLSRVAQDAATVCRAVSVRYLWIDAMCIMQGPDGDFHLEAARMEEVYASALFTICAGASADTTQPFLVHRDPLWWTHCDLVEDESRESWGFIRAGYCELAKDVPGKFNLDSRGWCFQEQFLSPRSIYFGPRDVHWICREGTVCDCYPNFGKFGGIKWHNGLQWQSPKQLYEKLVSLGVSIAEPETRLGFCDVWRNIRGNYSKRQFRYQSDRLLALAGVASIVQRRFYARASFGLWLEVFHEELLWINLGISGKGTRLDIAPTWSWANLGNCLISSFLETRPDPEYPLLNSVWATVISWPPVTGFAIPLRDSGSGYSTSIRLSGRLTACLQHRERNNQLIPRDYSPEPTRHDGRYFPDTTLEEKNLYCFLIKREIKVFVDGETGEHLNRGKMQDWCLVLTPVPGSNHRYRRVGYYSDRSDWDQDDSGATSLHTHMFRGEWKEQEIEII